MQLRNADHTFVGEAGSPERRLPEKYIAGKPTLPVMPASYLDLHTWPRRAHFELFRTYDNPFFSLCAPVDVGRLLEYVRETEDISFFLAMLYLATRVANELEPFRYRVRGDRVLVHDAVDAGSTVLNDDGTFGFVYVDFDRSFRSFLQSATVAMEARKIAADRLDPRDDRDDLIHFSVIPWISFTSFSHARRLSRDDSTPKIVFGKYDQRGDSVQMPVSVAVHHALMDGIHVGEFYSCLDAYLVDPEPALGETS